MVKPSRRTLAISALIAAFLTAITYLSVIDIHDNQSANIKSRIENSTSRIESRFNSIVENTSYVMKTINTRIAEDPYNYPYIYQTLRNFWGSEGADNSMAWTIFSWADADGRLVVDAVYGIIEKPIQLPKKRENMARSRNQPNTLQLGTPVTGATSHKWLIPMSMGLNDQDGNYAGAIIPGLNLTVLADRLKSEMKDRNITFYIIGKDNELLIDSSKKIQSQQNKLPAAVKEILQEENEKNSFYINSFSGNNYYTSPFSNYDYRIYAAYSPKVIMQEFYEELTTRFLILFILVLMVAYSVRYFYERDKKRQNIRFAELRRHTVRSDFLKFAGVEMKNVIARISNSAEKLKTTNQHVAEILEDTTDLDHFVDDLLDFTENGERGIKPEREFTDIQQVLERVYYLNSPFARRRHVKLKMMVQSKLPKLWADPRRLRQVLNSLVNNAIKYSRDGDQVCITVQAEEKNMRIAIEDNGVGIRPDELKKLFSKNNDGAVNSSRLYLVKKLVEAHDAKINIESEAENGTKATITFPLYKDIVIEEDDKKIVAFNPRKKARG